MSRSIATKTQPAVISDEACDAALAALDGLLDLEKPTRRLAAFRLPAEADPRLCEETTVSIGAEENKALLARVFGDEPTIAAPNGHAPALRLVASNPAPDPPKRAPVPARVAAPRVASMRPVAPAMSGAVELDVLTPAPTRSGVSSIAPFATLHPSSLPPDPASGTRPRVTAEMARAARQARAAEAAKGSAYDARTKLVVAALWLVALTMALSLAYVAMP